MLSSPNAVASHRGAVALFESGPRTPAGHASLHTPLVGGGVPAAMGAGETRSVISASPAPVLITEQQVMFATAAGAAWRTAAIRRPRIVLLWQRLPLRPSTQHPPRRNYPPRRASYIEHAAMAREMERQ
jgi:hypothetical protein